MRTYDKLIATISIAKAREACARALASSMAKAARFVAVRERKKSG